MNKRRQSALDSLLWSAKWWIKFISTVFLCSIILFAVLFYLTYSDYCHKNKGPFLVEGVNKQNEVYVFITCPDQGVDLPIYELEPKEEAMKM